ncbi:MAG: BMP family lipoprotein [Actinomycetota bacterium]
MRWVGLVLLGFIAGCGGSGTGGAQPPSGAGGVAVGMVTDTGGIGDLSFNMMAWDGLQRAEKEVGVVPSKIESQQVGDYADNLQRLAEKGCKLVVAVGYALEPAIKDVAPRYPNTHFLLIDSPGPSLPNVSGVVFREEEGSFLVGALGGGMSRSGKLGFVGGQEIPLIKKFEAGYRAGVRATNPSATVTAKYTNNWEDVPKGRELALSLFDQGADVIYHASGRCGVGVIQAAVDKGEGYWAIGVDADQDHLGTRDPKNPAPPSRVLTSMLKRVDNVVLAACKEAKAGELRSGVRELGVKEDGIGISPLKYTRDQIPAPLLKRVEELQAEIASGAVKPPKTLEELERWKAPAVK